MRRRVLVAIVATVVIGGAIAAYFAVRPVVAAVLAGRFGCEVTVDRVELAGTTLRAHGVHAVRCAEPVDVAIDVADLTSDGLSLRAAQVTLGIAGAVPVALAHVDGALTRRDGRARFELRFVLPTDAGPLPVALHGEQERDGIDVALRAKTLPVAALAPFAALAGSLVPEGGTLDDLDLHLRSQSASLDGGFALRDGTFAFGRHHLHGLTGTVALHDGALTADALVGTLDDAPVSFRGTMHAVPRADGSSDTLALADLVSKLADATLDDSDLGPLRGATFEALGPALLYADASMTTAVGPRVVHVIATDPREPSIKLDTALAHDSLVSGGLQTSALAKASGAVAGVNGDYFDIGRTYQPQGMYAHGGELLRSPTERAVLTIRKDGRIAVGTYAFHGTLQDGARTYRITRLNDFAEYVSVVTPALGTMQPEAGVMFAALEPVNPTVGRYRVTSVGPLAPGEPARFGVAFGQRIHEPLPHAGDVVTMHYATEPSLDGVSAVIGGGPQLLRDGAWYEDPHAPAPDERDVRWPVVAVARLPDERVLFVSVDGRHPERAVGMTRPEFAKMLQALGAIDAFALDSGGSVTMVARTPFSSDVQVRNRPSDDDGERFISNGLFVYSSAAPDVTPVPAVVMHGGLTAH